MIKRQHIDAARGLVNGKPAGPRFCRDLGLWAIDRGLNTCTHASPWCARNCYNRKFYARYGRDLYARDGRNNIWWEAASGHDLAAFLGRKRTFNGRLRLCTRGEPFSTRADIARVVDWCHALGPDVLVWAPTRAWRDPDLRQALEQARVDAPNLAVLASTDPSTRAADYRALVRAGWSTMHVGRTMPVLEAARDMDTSAHVMLCAKTWRKVHGACATCDSGCFRAARAYGDGRPVHIWLCQH